MHHHNSTSSSNKATENAGFSFEDLAALESAPFSQYKHMYVDICDDLVTGILLSKIVYWFGIGKNGEQRARHEHAGRVCIVKKKEDWWNECRISEGQYDRAIAKLIEKKIITTEVHYNPFASKPMQRATFIFINKEVLNSLVKSYLDSFKKESDRNPISPVSETPEMRVSERGEMQVSEHPVSGVSSYSTKNTTKTTSDILSLASPEGKKIEKLPFSENVRLTEDEHSKLLAQYGQQKLAWMIQKLSDSIAAYGKKYKSHYHVLVPTGWVHQEYEKQHNTTGKSSFFQQPKVDRRRRDIHGNLDTDNTDHLF